MTPKSPLFLYILQSLDWGPLHCGSRWAKAAKNKFPAWCDFTNLLTKFQQIYVYFRYRNVAIYTQTVAVFFLTNVAHSWPLANSNCILKVMLITYFFAKTGFVPREGPVSFTRPRSRPHTGSNTNQTRAHYYTHLCWLDTWCTIMAISVRPGISMISQFHHFFFQFLVYFCGLAQLWGKGSRLEAAPIEVESLGCNLQLQKALCCGHFLSILCWSCPLLLGYLL